MPDVTVHNETPDSLNIAFRFVAPANWKNSLAAGDTYKTHLSSTPYTVEVRINLENNQFSAEHSIATARDISLGWLAGAASVVVGGWGGMTGSTVGVAASAPLMKHAIQAGERFARNADGMVISVAGVWIPFYNKTFAVRFNEGSGYSLWDLDYNVKL